MLRSEGSVLRMVTALAVAIVVALFAPALVRALFELPGLIDTLLSGDFRF
ncbi:MAG TPA: hypothetical protein VHJ34_07060 [Actinomycetota bacterium]|nr:hypothetical protein [Actinomycetota bacterium]